MRTNRNPFSFADQRANWVQGINDLRHVSATWPVILKQIAAELDKFKKAPEPLSPIWKMFTKLWGLDDHNKAVKRMVDTNQLAQAFSSAITKTQTSISASKESELMNPSLFEAYQLPNPRKSADRHSEEKLDRVKNNKRKKPEATSTSSTPAPTRTLCRSCGQPHGGDCNAVALQHPDVNKEDKPWAESSMGKLYKGLKRSCLRINSRLNAKRDGFMDKVIYTRPSGKTDSLIFNIDTPETHLPSPYIMAKAVTPDGASVSIDRVLLDTGSLKSNFISTELYNSLTPIFGLGKPTKHCACSAFIGVCQSNLIKFNFKIDIFNELSNSYFTLPLNTYVIDSPVPLIIGRPDIIKHQLFVKIPSQMYIGTDASRVLCDHCTRPATEEEYCVLIKERQELLDADNYGLSEELVGDEPAQPWDEEPTSDIPTEIHGSDAFKESIRVILEAFRDVFSRALPTKPADVTPMRINIITQKHQECKMQRQARIQSAVKNAEIHRQVRKMIANNLIAPSQAYKFSQVLLTPKKNNTWRFCIDYRRVNDCTEPSGWPIPIIDEMIQRLGRSGAKYFGILDFTQGFYQCPMAEESQIYTAFRTFSGTYVWKRVPMGLKGAPSYFQATMQNEVLHDLIYRTLEIYIDDILLYAKSEEEYLNNLTQLLRQLRAKNVKINPDKTALGLEEVEFVGHTLTRTGIKFSDKKRHEILKVELPATQRQMKHFIGLALYYQKAIPSLIEWTAPFHEMTKRYNPSAAIPWTEELQRKFHEFKDAIFNMPSRWFQDSVSPVYLHTDASQYGIGGYLYQLYTDPVTGIKSERVIEFVSKAFTSQQKKWNTTDQEAFAIFFCITKLQNRLRDIKFTLRTDHRNLLFINDASSARVLRWKMALQEYMFNIEHVAGKDNIVADNLSRIPNITHDSEDDRVDMLYALDEFEIPQDIRDAFDKVHNSAVGHMGFDRTIERLKELNITHPYLRNIVRTLLRTCDICQKQSRRRPHYDTTLFTASSDHPMQRINIDTIGPFPEDQFGYKYILTIIDTFSRWTSVYPTKTTNAQEAAIALLQHVAIFGTPAQILTDNGSQFMNELFKHLFALLGTKGIKTIPYSKEENSIVERANKEIQRHLEALCYDRDHSQSWSLYLPIVQRILNASVHSATGQKPATLLFANLIDLDKGIFLPLDELPPPNHITNIPEWLAEIYTASQALLSLARTQQDEINNENLTSRQSKRKHHKSLIPTSSIQIGDIVTRQWNRIVRLG